MLFDNLGAMRITYSKCSTWTRFRSTTNCWQLTVFLAKHVTSILYQVYYAQSQSVSSKGSARLACR